jgi:hypothetical protein
LKGGGTKAFEGGDEGLLLLSAIVVVVVAAVCWWKTSCFAKQNCLSAAIAIDPLRVEIDSFPS